LVEEQKPRFFYGYIVVVAAFGIWLTAWGMQQTYGVFYKPILSEFGWTRAFTAGARSLNAGIVGLLGIVTGGLTDRIGPRRVVLIFASFLGLGFLLISQISTAWQFYVTYGLVVGIGLSAAAIPTMTTVARWFVKRRGLMTGLVQTGGSIGGAILAPVAGWLIITYGWRSAFLILGIIAVVLIILPGAFLRRDPSQMGLLPYGASDRGEQAAKSKGKDSTKSRFSIRETLCTRRFWLLAIMLFSFGFTRTAIMVHIAAHVTDLGYSLLTGAKVISVISGASIAGRIGMGRVADIIGNRRTYMIGFVIIAASLFWVMVTGELWSLYLFAIAFGFSFGTLAVIRMPMIAEVFGLASLGTILGTLEFSSQIGAVVGPFLGGWLFDTTGEYVVAFLVSAVIAVIGLVSTILLKPIVAEGEIQT